MSPSLLKPGLTGLLYFFALVFTLISCRKDDGQGVAPVVTIEFPVGNQNYSVLDTIWIRVSVSHPDKIDYVRVAVLNDNLTPVLPVKEFIPEVTEYHLVTGIAIENQLLESGKYFIRVRAGAGNQVTTQYSEITIAASERIVESIIAVCSNQKAEFRVFDTDMNWVTKQRFSFGGDYLGSAVDARTRMFYSCGNIDGNLNAWRLEDNQLNWSLPAIANPPLPYFTQLFSSGGEVFVATRDAFITGYNASGLSTFKTPLYTNGYFGSMALYNSKVISVFEPFNSPFNSLVVFNYPGGTVFQSMDFQGSVIKMVNYGQDGLLVFMNIEGGSAICHYQFAENRLVRLKEFALGEILSVTMSGENQGFIAVANGIYCYRPAGNSLVKFLTIDGVSNIADDHLTNRLYVASGSEIKIFQWPVTTLEKSIELPHTIEDLHLRYNK